MEKFASINASTLLHSMNFVLIILPFWINFASDSNYLPTNGPVSDFFWENIEVSLYEVNLAGLRDLFFISTPENFVRDREVIAFFLLYSSEFSSVLNSSLLLLFFYLLVSRVYATYSFSYSLGLLKVGYSYMLVYIFLIDWTRSIYSSLTEEDQLLANRFDGLSAHSFQQLQTQELIYGLSWLVVSIKVSSYQSNGQMLFMFLRLFAFEFDEYGFDYGFIDKFILYEKLSIFCWQSLKQN